MSRECRMMVGQHGPNLANSIFMDPGCQLVEISNMSTSHAAGLYTHLASLIGLKSVLAKVDDLSGESMKVIEDCVNKFMQD